MLEQRDLQAIAELIDSRMSKTEEKLEEKVVTLDQRISDVERTLIHELVRTEDKISRRIGRVEKSLGEIKQYFKFDKLDNGEAALTLRLLKVAKAEKMVE